MSERFEVGVVRTVEAIHAMPFDDGPEGRPHPHDYRVEVVVTASELDDRGMAVDLLDLGSAVDDALQIVRGADLESVRPADVLAVTVEVFARWIHDRVRDRLARGAVAVRVWEDEGAFGGYRGDG